MQTALVTGTLGFSPLHLTKQLLAARYHVTATDRPATLNDSGRRALAKNIGLDLSNPNLHLEGAYLLDLPSLQSIDIPLLPLDLVQPVAEGVATSWLWLEQNLDVPRVRILAVQSAPYIGSSYLISNRKVLETGFVYDYGDARDGLKNTIAWFRKQGVIQ